MYLDFYGFSENPFSLSPNPRFIFFSKTHKEAFALLLYGINSHFGFIELTGEVGTGKTTVLRTLLSQLDEDKYRTALIFNPSQTTVDLMRAVNHEFGIPCQSDNVAELLGELNLFLLEENSVGRTVVLIIDEAQNLLPALLEQIRLISNLETDTDKLIQIVLAGQPELGRMLEQPELRQLDQRIALRYKLHPLDREDSAAYIGHRLALAGGADKAAFSSGALAWIYRYSRGTPRLINILCDRALLVAYTEDRRKVTARTVALAFRDVMLKPALSCFPKLRRGAVAALVAVVMAVGGYNLLAHMMKGKAAKAPAVKSAGEPVARHVAPAVKPVTPNVAKPAAVPAVKTAVVAPAVKPVPPPAPKSVAVPVTKPIAVPVAKPVAAASVKPATAPVLKPAVAPAAKPAVAPAAKPPTAAAPKGKSAAAAMAKTAPAPVPAKMSGLQMPKPLPSHIMQPAPLPVSAKDELPAIQIEDKRPVADSPSVEVAQPAPPVSKKALANELALRSEAKNAVQAFNALAPFWRVAPVTQMNERPPLMNQIKGQAGKRNLEMAPFKGKLDELLRIDSPAFLALSPKGSKGSYIVALTGVRNGRLHIQPSLLGRNDFSKKEIASLWSGRAYIPWRNGEKIPANLAKGSAGSDVIRLQVLLQTAGFHSAEVNGLYDENTAKTVRDFQASRKIRASGKVDPVTLIQLYKAVNGASAPSLARPGKGGGE